MFILPFSFLRYRSRGPNVNRSPIGLYSFSFLKNVLYINVGISKELKSVLKQRLYPLNNLFYTLLPLIALK